MTVKDRLKITEKTLKNKKNERILKCALFFMLGMLFSLGSVFGELRPFGVSITAVSKKRYFLFKSAQDNRQLKIEKSIYAFVCDTRNFRDCGLFWRGERA